MGWSLPDISLEDLLTLIKGFVDILILASGYQSSGRHAHWDSQNIKKAFQWGLFFEDVCRRLSSLEDINDSVMELNSALSALTSNPLFPQGLANLSFSSLSKASEIVSVYLLQTMPLTEAHLKAFLSTIIKMDCEESCEIQADRLHVYLEKLKLLDASLKPVPGEKNLLQVARITPTESIPGEKGSENGFTQLAVLELLQRQVVVTCISSAESGIDAICKSIRPSNWGESDRLSKEQLIYLTAQSSSEQLHDLTTWSTWMSKIFSYFLDRRTIRLVSGASMMFSSPKIQWVQVFQRLSVSLHDSEDDFSEAIEILVLGCIACRWSQIIEYVMSISFVPLTISQQYHELLDLLPGGSRSLPHNKEMMNSKENDILEYLTEILGGQLHQLWKLPPALVAAAIPSWSSLFKLNLSEIDSQFKGEASLIRFCSSCLVYGSSVNIPWCCWAFFHIILKAILFFSVYAALVQQSRRSTKIANLVREFGASMHFMSATPVCCLSQLNRFAAARGVRKWWHEKLRMTRLKGFQFLKWKTAISSSRSAVPLLRVQTRLECCPGLHVLRRYVWKLKSQWRQVLGCQRRNAKYSYDPQSYSQNFDNGSLHDRVSPLAPR